MRFFRIEIKVIFVGIPYFPLPYGSKIPFFPDMGMRKNRIIT